MLKYIVKIFSNQITISKYIRIIRDSYVFGFFGTLAFAFIAITSRIFHKNSRGFEFNLNALSDDGKIYLYKQLQFSNIPKNEINNIISSFYPNNIPVSENMILVGTTRPLFPFISSYFGYPSFIKLLIVPIISYLIINLILFHILSTKLGIIHTLAIIFIFNNSFYVKYNLITNTTEALANLFYIIFFLSLVWNKNLRTLIVGVLAGVLAIYTRPLDLALFLPSLCLLVFSRRKLDLYFSIIIVLLTTLHTFWTLNFLEYDLKDFQQVNFQGNYVNLLDYIYRYSSSLITELIYVLLFDGFAAIIFCLGIYAIMQSNFRYKYLYIANFFSLSILNIISGGSGKGLRYFIPFMLISIIFYAESVRKSN